MLPKLACTRDNLAPRKPPTQIVDVPAPGSPRAAGAWRAMALPKKKKQRRGGGEIQGGLFDLGSTQRQDSRGSGPEQIQADCSIGFDQLASSSTRRRRGHDEAGHGTLLHPAVFDLGSIQQQVALSSGPGQLQAGPSIGFNQLLTSSKRRLRGHDEAGQGALLRPAAFDFGSTQWQVVRGLGPARDQNSSKLAFQ